MPAPNDDNLVFAALEFIEHAAEMPSDFGRGQRLHEQSVLEYLIHSESMPAPSTQQTFLG
jgi:hypothetical protein